MNASPGHQQAFSIWNQHTAEHTSRSRVDADIFAHDVLQQAYPNHHITRTSPAKSDLLGYAAAGHAVATRVTSGGYDATRVYRPPRSNLDGDPGKLQDVVNFGRCDYQWGGTDFIVYEMSYVNRWSQYTKLLFVLIPRAAAEQEDPEGHDKRSDDLLMQSGQWTNELHEQIWVFDNSRWQKNKRLWEVVRDASWDNVILDPAVKASLHQDVHAFFDARALYQRAKIPWKRGIIFHGLPGNGKTLSIKVLIHTLATRTPPIPSLYVKSLDACAGPKWSIQQIFQKARRSAPCLLVLEDLDSLVGEATRSYFLNEVDGLEPNDGLLMVGSTNHLDRLDAAVTKRPSRFDRIYHFEIPNGTQRLAYCQHWQSRFSDADVGIPTELCTLIATWTEDYSFAYLNELFVTSLLLYTTRGAANDSVSEKNQDGREAADIPSSPLLQSSNALSAIFQSQAQALRYEMDHAVHERTSAKFSTNLNPAVQYRMAAPLDEVDE